jgi:hypothetical protein
VAAVVRVKRRSNKELLETLVLACRRQKLGYLAATENEIPFTTVLKSAGTVKIRKMMWHHILVKS